MSANPADPTSLSSLASTALQAFGETVAVLGAAGARGSFAVRKPNAVGACTPSMPTNAYINMVVVLPDAPMPDNTEDLPYCIWTYSAAPIAGRIESPDCAMPSMVLLLDEYNFVPEPIALPSQREPKFEPISLSVR